MSTSFVTSVRNRRGVSAVAAALGGSLVLLGMSVPATASVTSQTGFVTKLTTAPTSVRPNVLKSDTLIRVFNEKQDLMLTTPLEVDARYRAAIYDDSGDLNGNGFTIPAGERVSSHYLHADPSTTGTKTLTGTVTFDRPVRGIILTDNNLALSDAVLGSPTTAYPTSAEKASRGVELGGGEHFRLSSNKKTLTLTLKVGQDADVLKKLDGMRVITDLNDAPATNTTSAVAAASATTSANEGQTAAMTGTWSDADGADTVVLSASSGTIVKSGTNAAGTWSWSLPTTDGPAGPTTVMITANDGTASTTTTFTYSVTNVAPAATFSSPGVDEGSPISLALTNPSDPSSVDTTTGFSYAFDCGTGYGAFGPTATASCPTTDNGSRNVGGKIKDKDGGTSTYTDTVTIANVAPQATFSTSFATAAPVVEGTPITVSLATPTDPSSADRTAGFTYAFDCGTPAGYGAFASAASTTCATTDNGSRTIRATIKDKDGGSNEYTVTGVINNANPTATFSATDPVDEGSPITIALSNPSDPSSADTTAGFTYAFSCDGTTFGPASVTATDSCATTDDGSRTVRGKIVDKDLGATTYSATLSVVNIAPTATFSAPTTPVDEGSSVALALTGGTDPSTADMTAGLDYAFDCGTGYGPYGAATTKACPTTDDGTLTVHGKVRDKDGASTEYTRTVTVRNVAPSATFVAPAAADEGEAFSLALTGASDPSEADQVYGLTYTYDCGDGAGFTTSTSCATTDNGARFVHGKVTDKDGGSRVYDGSVAVANVAPTADLIAPTTVAEGDIITLTLGSADDVSDVDTAAGFSYAFDCGTPAGYGQFAAADTVDCPTTDNGTRAVGATIRDKDGGVRAYTASVTVSNVKPTAVFAAPTAVNEGTSIALALTDATDASSADVAAGFTYQFVCGTTASAFATTASATCPTSDGGTVAVTGRIKDKDGGVEEYSATVTVDNVAPAAKFTTSPPVTEGSPIEVSLTEPVDPSSADTTAGFRYKFDCGDGLGYGVSSAVTSVSCPTNDNGTRTLKATIQDKDGGAREYTAEGIINNANPSATFSATSPVNEGSAITLEMTKPFDPSSVDTSAGFTYSYDCGSGTLGLASAASTSSCPTDDNGPDRTVRSRIFDKDGGFMTYSATVVVNNVAPTAVLHAPVSVNEGSNILLSLTGAYDPSGPDTAVGFTLSYDCGLGAGWVEVGTCPTTDNTSTGAPRTVKARIMDKDLGETVYTADVTVNNVAPTATFDATTPITEGRASTLTLKDATDVSSADVGAGFTYAFDCGSGYSAFAASATATCSTTDDGTLHAAGKVMDKDGGVKEYTQAVDVTNVAPTGSFGASSPVNEGSDMTLSIRDVADPSSADTAHGFSYQFNCGTGYGPAGQVSTATCPTNDNGSVTVQGKVSDKDGGFTEYTQTVTVANVAPEAKFTTSPSVVEGSPIEMSLTDATDPSSADTDAGFTYAFDCGTGTGYAAYGMNSSISCPTSDNGERTLKAKIRDKNLGEREYTAKGVINNANPSATFSASNPVDEGSAIALALSNPFDPSTADMTAGFTYAFSCDNVTFKLASATATDSCATTDDGTRAVAAKIFDKDGGSMTYSSSVTVNNVAPTATFGAPATVHEASPIALSLTGATDVSSADTLSGFTYAFDCGTGYGAYGPATTASCPTTDDGTRTVGGRVKDKDGGVSTYTSSVAINNVAPKINGFTVTRAAGAACTGTGNAVTVTFTVADPAQNTADPTTGTITWGDGATSTISGRTVSASHSYAAGTYSLTAVVNDGDGGVDQAGAAGNVSLQYATSGVLQPINTDGTSTFKIGSTIPVKLRITDCTGALVGTIRPQVSLRKLLITSGTVNEVVSTSAADTGSIMRFDGSQNIYNLSTKNSQFNAGQSLTQGRYELTLSDPTIKSVVVQFDLRS